MTDVGWYTAPGYSGTFTVRATSVAAPSVFGEATAVVNGTLTVVVVPTDAVACTSVQLQAVVTGSTTPTVTWTALDPTCAVVTPAGAFQSSRGTGGCPVRACSTVDPGACGEALVNVTAEHVLQVSVSPLSASLGVNGTQLYQASVKTTCGDFAAGS